MEKDFSAMATRGQYPINNLLNPFAWAKFVTGIKNGLLKNHSFKKPEPAKVAKKKKKIKQPTAANFIDLRTLLEEYC